MMQAVAMNALGALTFDFETLTCSDDISMILIATECSVFMQILVSWNKLLW